MHREVYRTGEPYKLLGNRIVFTNWYYVSPGCFGWYDEKGLCVSVIGDQGPLDAHMRHEDHPWGIRLSSKPGLRSGQIFKIERPWEEGGISISTILKESNIYRAWGSTGWGDLKAKSKKYFCYFESKNGIDWERPNCGIIEYDGNRNNNLLGTEGGTVFIDTFAPDSERYKWITEAHFTKEEYDKYCKKRPDTIDPRSDRKDANLFIGVRGAVSPDGLHWTILLEPLVMTHSDTQVVAYYDTFLRKYVGYFRDWMVGPQAKDNADEKGLRWLRCARRAIGRAETDNFRVFPLPELIIEPSPDMSPNHVLYTNCRTTIPEASDQHLMFPAVWDTGNDTTHIRLLSSHNGKTWNYVPGGTILDTANFGEWDGGCIFASPNLIDLPNGDFALPYTGYNFPHKYPRQKAVRSVGYAFWPKGRIVALESIEKGGFSTVAIIPPSNRLLINAITKRAGYILIEAAGLNGKPIHGREFDNSVPIIGDNYKTPVLWKNHDNLGVKPGEAIILRFKMDQAGIYSLDFKTENL